MAWCLALSVAVASSPAEAAKPDGVQITVRVLNQDNMPISTAVVRHPEEQERHPVNAETGEWRASVLYLADGTEFQFEKGMQVQFEVSAPGYKNARVQYTVRKRKNLFEVALEPLEPGREVAGEEAPVIRFRRDKPIDGAPEDSR